MAVLNKIRQQSLVLILVIAMALFAFILSGIFDGSASFSNKSQNVVATVNGKDIKREDFVRKVENAQRQLGQNATNAQATSRVWDAEVRQAVMETQFDELGFTVEREQMRDLIKARYAQDPTFLNEDGIFDEAKLDEFLANLKANAESDPTSRALLSQWLDQEAQMALNAKQQSYYNMVKAGLTATIEEGKMEHELEGNKVDLKFVQIPYNSINDTTINVSKSEIADYLKKHSKQFQVEKSRDINFVLFKEEPTLDDENAIKKELTDYINGKVIYNERTQTNDTIVAFTKATNNEEYVNVIAGSDIKYNSSYLFKNAISATIADSINNLSEGETFGPYKENGLFKVTKLIAVKQLPDSVKSRHILIPFIGANGANPAEVTQTEAQAKATADSLVTVLKRNKSKFAGFVTEFTSDKGSIENGGKYDWYPYNQMVPEFRDFTFEGKTGDIGVVKTVFGFHIIEIEGQKGKEKAVKLATIARKIEPSEKTIDDVFTTTSKFEIAIDKGNFQDIAKENNYVVRPVGGIKVMQENIPGVGDQRAITRWTYEVERKVGDVERFTIPGGGYAVVQLNAINESGLMSVDNASATVTPIIKKEKKAVQIRKNITATTLQEVATSQNQTVKTALAVNMKNPTLAGAGLEPKVVGTAFGLKEGATSGLINGERGVYMVEVTKLTPAVELPNYQAKANQITQRRINAVNTQLFNALKEAAEIEDNRASTIQ